jgi:hypothetical protein
MREMWSHGAIRNVQISNAEGEPRSMTRLRMVKPLGYWTVHLCSVAALIERS